MSRHPEWVSNGGSRIEAKADGLPTNFVMDGGSQLLVKFKTNEEGVTFDSKIYILAMMSKDGESFEPMCRFFLFTKGYLC